MSAWKLVEAISSQTTEQQQNNVANGSSSGREFRGRRNTNNSFSNRRPQFSKFSTLATEEKDRLLEIVYKKIDRLFDHEALAANVFLRSYFDVEGYVPLAFVCNCANVVHLGIPIRDIMKKFQTAEKYECDVDNETFRLRDGWEKWRMPTPSGLGVPRYIVVSTPRQAPHNSNYHGHRAEGESHHSHQPRNNARVHNSNRHSFQAHSNNGANTHHSPSNSSSNNHRQESQPIPQMSAFPPLPGQSSSPVNHVATTKNMAKELFSNAVSSTSVKPASE